MIQLGNHFSDIMQIINRAQKASHPLQLTATNVAAKDLLIDFYHTNAFFAMNGKYVKKKQEGKTISDLVNSFSTPRCFY